MDGVIKSEVHYQDHTDILTQKTSQPSENIILNRNAELRKNEGAIRDLGAETGKTWGRQVASIQLILLDKAKRDGYDIYCKDQEIASKELHRWLTGTPEGQSCLIRSKM